MHPSARSLGLKVVRKQGNEELLLCPFHVDHNPSASYNRQKGLFYCHVCGFGLNVAQLVKRLGVDIEISEEDLLDKEPEEYTLVSDSEDLPLGIEAYHPYFAVRGVSPNTARIYNLQWSYVQRAAVLPITDLRGNTIGALLRYEFPKAAGTRYRKFGTMQPLWPMHTFHYLPDTTRILVAEGPWSALRVHSYLTSLIGDHSKVRCIVSTLGARANKAVADVLRPYRHVDIVYDGDSAGKRACREMRKLLPSANCWTVRVSPDNMNEEQIEHMLNRLDEEWEKK